MTPFTYAAFGLKIGSELECPELCSGDGPSQVHFRYASLPSASDHSLPLHAFPRKYLLTIPGVARYLVSNGSEVLVDPEPNVDDGAVRVFLLGSCMGALLHQRRALPLHASAVATRRGAVIFAGPSGSGKSTLAAFLFARGFGTLADDVCVIGDTGRPFVHSGTAGLSVWADALRELGIGHSDLRPVRTGLKKYFLPVKQRLPSEPIPLHGVYILSTSSLGSLGLEPMTGFAKFEALLENTYRKSFLEPMGLAQSHCTEVAKIAGRIKVSRVSRPRDGFRIADLIDLLVEDFER